MSSLTFQRGLCLSFTALYLIHCNDTRNCYQIFLKKKINYSILNHDQRHAHGNMAWRQI